MSDQSERLTRLINDVLDLSRIESGKMPWREEPLDMAEVVADAVLAVEGRLENRPNVHMRLDLPRRLPQVVADRDRIPSSTRQRVWSAAPTEMAPSFLARPGRASGRRTSPRSGLPLLCGRGNEADSARG